MNICSSTEEKQPFRTGNTQDFEDIMKERILS